jgi:hypothetical protein
MPPGRLSHAWKPKRFQELAKEKFSGEAQETNLWVPHFWPPLPEVGILTLTIKGISKKRAFHSPVRNLNCAAFKGTTLSLP